MNPRLSRELGSRHRCTAIGLTEENDSVAVVVSEETGMISLVLDGDIERGLTPDDLRRRLRRLVLFRREERARSAVLPSAKLMGLFRHLGLKLLSFALAVLLLVARGGTEGGGAIAARSAGVPERPAIARDDRRSHRLRGRAPEGAVGGSRNCARASSS